MGALEQILLCHSLASGLFTEYLGEVKQQQSLHRPELIGNQLGQRSRRTSNSASTQLYESIQCVLNGMDANSTSALDTSIHNVDGKETSISLGGVLELISSEPKYELPQPISTQTTYKQLSVTHENTRTRPGAHQILASRLLRSSLRETAHTLCRLRETLNNYYMENCIFNLEIAPLTAITHNSGLAFPDAISAGAAAASLPTTTTLETVIVRPELGDFFGKDSIMGSSLTQPTTGHPLTYNWNFLFFVIIFIIAGGLGNILVCLAIALDRKLQNVTNYFLLSLAIADLLVSLFVMPLGAIPTFLGGHWPLGEHWCNVYVTCDVLACSASIWHMCFISLGRYLGIKNPLGSRHRATKRIVGIKIAVCWLMAMPVSSSIAVLGSMDMQNIIPQPNVCTINNKQFFVFGSLVAFYIPMVIMVSTYALTVQLLRKKARFAAATHPPESEIFQSLMSHRLGGTNRYAKNSTGGCAGVGIDHVEATNLKQSRPYLKGKVKSISDTDLGKSMHRHVSAPRLKKSEVQTNYQAHTHHPASAMNSENTEASHLPSFSDANLLEDLETQSVFGQHNNNNKGIVPYNHKKRTACSSITSISNVLCNNAALKKKVFTDTCDRATQTSPKPLKRPPDMRGNKLKLNIQSVASPYLNLNLRLPNNRKRANLSANAVANEQKATKVLGIVFFTFVLCWAPFFVLNIVMVLYPRENIPDHVIDVCLWLGYVSSTINPIIYTIFNRTFRAAFIRLLRCDCQRSGRPYRYRSVTETKGAASLCARSALPLAISLQGTGYYGQSQSSTCNMSTTVTDSEC